MNLALWITISRILLLPFAVLPVVLFNEEGWLACAVACALAGFSDFADGYLARKRHEETLVGKNLDFVSDKLFVCVMLIFMAIYGLLPAWIPLVVLIREGLVSFWRFQASRFHLQQPDFLGKLKTAVSYLAIVWTALLKYHQVGGFAALKGLDADMAPVLSFAPWVMLSAVFLTVLSGFNYLWKYSLVIRAGQP
jgi:CDP-diacylglycerol---glycerol-3-phosphate 3-phosphatidyltransferase